MVDAPQISVEVVYASADQQTVIELQVASASTVREVIELSGILQQFPEIDIKKNGVGIFGRRVALTQTVLDEDRIELYRPLLADPKQLRREKASIARASRPGRK